MYANANLPVFFLIRLPKTKVRQHCADDDDQTDDVNDAVHVISFNGVVFGIAKFIQE